MAAISRLRCARVEVNKILDTKNTQSEDQPAPLPPVPLPKSTFVQWGGFLLKLLVAGGLLFALYKLEIISISEMGRAASDPVNLSFVGVSVISMILVTVYRWRMLLASQGMALSFSSLFQVYYISLAYTPILPGGIGGDAMRIAYTVGLSPENKVKAAVSVFVDRLVALVGLLLASFLMVIPYIPKAMEGSTTLLIGILFVGAMISGCTLFFALALKSSRRLGVTDWLRARFSNRLAKVVITGFDSLASYRGHPKVVIGAIALSMVNQVFVIFAIVVIATRLGFAGLAITDIGIATTLTQIANVLPLTPGGIGVGEAAFSQLLVILTSGNVGGAVVAGYGSIFLTYRVLSILVTLPGLICYLMFSTKKKTT